MDQNDIVTLALDRIAEIRFNLKVDHINEPFDADEFYKNTYGVTVLDQKHVLDIEFIANRHNTPYIITKPLHHSQQLLEKYADGRARFSIQVHHNFEIERLFLGFGEGITVLKPRNFKRRIIWKLRKALEFYERNAQD